jgi:hypothetical protein
MDLDRVFVFVDAVDDAVGATPRGVVAVEGFLQRFAHPVRVGGDRSLDGLHGG